MLLCGYFLQAFFLDPRERDRKNWVKMSVYKVVQNTEQSWFVFPVVKGSIIFNSVILSVCLVDIIHKSIYMYILDPNQYIFVADI